MHCNHQQSSSNNNYYHVLNAFSLPTTELCTLYGLSHSSHPKTLWGLFNNYCRFSDGETKAPWGRMVSSCEPNQCGSWAHSPNHKARPPPSRSKNKTHRSNSASLIFFFFANMYFKMFTASQHKPCKPRAVRQQPSLPTVYNSKQHFNLKNHTLVFALLILTDLQITSLWLKFILKMWSIYLYMDIWSKKMMTGQDQVALVTEASEIFFFFFFLGLSFFSWFA